MIGSAWRGRYLMAGLYLLAVAALSATVGWVTFGTGLARLAERGQADLALASDRLTNQLTRYRELAVMLADHPTLWPLLLEGRDRTDAEALLLGTADRSSADDFVLVGRDGRVLARARGEASATAPPGAGTAARTRAGDPAGVKGGPAGASARPLPGQRLSPAAPDTSGLPDYATQAFFNRALQGTTAFHHGLTGNPPRRIFSYAVPVRTPGGRVGGAVIARIDASRVEADWRGAAPAIYFTDARGVVFVSNRDELLLRQTPERGDPKAARRIGYAPGAVRPFPAHETFGLVHRKLWWIDAGPYLPGLVLPLVRPLPVVGLTGHILLDAMPALRLALLQAGFTATLCLVLGAVILAVAERRRLLALRLHAEARAKAGLERRVAARTRALSETNQRLLREIAERQEAEAALKKAQEDLVQAGKLSALGQMSAGISHELNQPLMAIRSFAENATAFIDRGEPTRAMQNLDRISDLAHRMGRIIRNLRAFARQETEAIADVDLVAAAATVLEMADGRMRDGAVTLHYDPPSRPLMVRGGEVRLQQVLLNLVTNALDAVEGRPDRQLWLAIVERGETVRLSLRDSGSGINEPDRIFDPFYSTKEVGRSEGMGLGLSISYGIVNSFGGTIIGANHPAGGAEFTVTLKSARRSEAA